MRRDRCGVPPLRKHVAAAERRHLFEAEAIGVNGVEHLCELLIPSPKRGRQCGAPFRDELADGRVVLRVPYLLEPQEGGGGQVIAAHNRDVPPGKVGRHRQGVKSFDITRGDRCCVGGDRGTMVHGLSSSTEPRPPE